MPTLTIYDREIYYEITGEGIPVILLHGYCEDLRIWDSIYESIGGKVLRIDLPGFGRSEVISSGQLEEYANIVSNAAKQMGFEKYILFGHSMGGYIGMEILEKKPAELIGLGLVHSHPFGDANETKDKRDKAIDFIQKNGSRNFARSMIPNLFLDPREQSATIDMLIERCGEFEANGVINATQAMRDRPDLSALLTSAEIPIFYFTGREDPAIPVDRLLGTVSETLVSFVNVIQDAAHMGMYESPDRMIIDMNLFIEYCSR